MKTYCARFIRLKNDEKIQIGDFHSLDNGRTLATVKNEETAGDRPKNFGEGASFWRLNSVLYAV